MYIVYQLLEASSHILTPQFWNILHDASKSFSSLFFPFSKSLTKYKTQASHSHFPSLSNKKNHNVKLYSIGKLFRNLLVSEMATLALRRATASSLFNRLVNPVRSASAFRSFNTNTQMTAYDQDDRGVDVDRRSDRSVSRRDAFPSLFSGNFSKLCFTQICDSVLQFVGIVTVKLETIVRLDSFGL